MENIFIPSRTYCLIYFIWETLILFESIQSNALRHSEKGDSNHETFQVKSCLDRNQIYIVK
jgi:hypothetical protein